MTLPLPLPLPDFPRRRPWTPPERELAVAGSRAEQIGQETPQAHQHEPDVIQWMEVVQVETEALRQDVASEQEHISDTIDFWGTSSA